MDETGFQDPRKATAPIKGRGAASRVAGRFEKTLRVGEDDGWGSVYEADESPAPLPTTVTEETARGIISRNDSPDIGFSQSINPYRGCEHGCVYCFARPSHAYLELSPGLDFETKLFAKTNAVERLREELAKPSHHPAPIALGINTDGQGPFADLIRQRFDKAYKRLGFERLPELDESHFVAPRKASLQGQLF